MVLATINYKIDEKYTQNFSFKLRSINNRVFCTIYRSSYNPADVLKLKADYNLEFDTIQLIRKVSTEYSLNSVKADAARHITTGSESKLEFSGFMPTQAQNIMVPVTGYEMYSNQPNSLFAFNSQIQSRVPEIYPPAPNFENKLMPLAQPVTTKQTLGGPAVQKLNAYVQQLQIHIKENSNGIPDFNSSTAKNINKSRNFIKSILNVKLSEEEYQYILAKLKQN